ncbi:hypothetical protein [Chitinophaga filiformis]|nr:hypothetical protein [Chitinophaga filiformis]
MTTAPIIQFQNEEYYVAIRSEVKMPDIPTMLPRLSRKYFSG